MDEHMETLKAEARMVHARLCDAVARLDEEQLARQLSPSAPSIAFHLFHVARWNDFDQAEIRGVAQIWHTRRLAEAWAIDETSLGKASAGTGMDEASFQRLELPPKQPLLEYASAAFDAFDRLESVDHQRLAVPLVHDNRHLGMVEALIGVLGLSGSATD